MRGWIASFLLLAMLAGCADAPADDNTETFADGSEITFDDAEATATTGGISGVVVDETITPIAGAVVVLMGPNTEAITGENGGFTFGGLDPGFYNLRVNGTGFLGVQSTAQVEAGDVAKLRVVLPRDTSPQPHHETLQFAWFDSVGQPLVDFAIDLFVGGDAPRACDTCEWHYTAQGPVETTVIEAVWEDSPAPPPHKDSEFYWTLEPTEDTSDYESDYFYSPGLAHIGGNKWGEYTEFFLMMAAEEEWIVVDQSAEVFISLFYVAEAPEGWSFVAGDR